MALKKITAADFNTAIKKLTTSDASVWWKTLGETEDGTKLCFVMGWNDGYDADEDGTMYQQDGYTLCTKIGYKPSNLMVMDYTDFNMPYDKKTAEVWDTDMSVGKGEVTDDAFDVKWYNDEAEAIWKKYGKPDREGKTALDLMESKKKEAKKHTCSMQKKKESLAKQNEYRRGELDFRGGFDFNGKPKKSVISKISKALDKVGISAVVDPSGERLKVPFGDDAVYMTAMSQSYGSNKCSYVNVRQKSDRNTDVGVYNVGDAVKVVQEITQGLDAPNESKKHTCSMQKKKESLAKKCEEYIPNVRERLWSFIDAGFITTEEIGDYLLRALSVDTLENVYEWLVQDEMIPSEETLADEHQLKFGDDGEFVSIETDDSTESKKS